MYGSFVKHRYSAILNLSLKRIANWVLASPFSGRHLPFLSFFDRLQNQEEQLGGAFIGREVAAGPEDTAQFAAQGSDGVSSHS